jgi:hypothetical protein
MRSSRNPVPRRGGEGFPEKTGLIFPEKPVRMGKVFARLHEKR